MYPVKASIDIESLSSTLHFINGHLQPLDLIMDGEEQFQKHK